MSLVGVAFTRCYSIYDLLPYGAVGILHLPYRILYGRFYLVGPDKV